MNSSSLGLMTYCSLAKELMGIKNSTHKLKYSIFTQNSQQLQLNHFKSFFSQTSLSKLNNNQNSNSNYSLKTNQIRTKNKTKQI